MVAQESSGLSRRGLLATTAAAGAAGAVVAVTGCSTYGGSDDTPAVATPGGSAKAGAGGGTLAQVSDIPVGGGKIFTAQRVVVTQPEAGTIKAFSATCTHQGCQVTSVREGTINCPCHGSQYKIADGSVASGPAPAPLPAVQVTVEGTAITLA